MAQAHTLLYSFPASDIVLHNLSLPGLFHAYFTFFAKGQFLHTALNQLQLENIVSDCQ